MKLLAFICIQPFISGFTNLQCSLFAVNVTLNQARAEKQEMQAAVRRQISILDMFFTKPLYFTHPALRERVIRRGLLGNRVEIPLEKVAFHSQAEKISPSCSRFFSKM